MEHINDDIREYMVAYLREATSAKYLSFIEAICNQFSHLGENRGWLIMNIKNELEAQGIIVHDKTTRMIRINRKTDKRRKQQCIM